jgi:1-deoxy-D-xylulose-5-phosphate reductoisomerase
MTVRTLSIFGATGSIGQSALHIVRQHRQLFQIEVLSGHNNIQLMAELAHEFRPKIIVISNPAHLAHLKDLTQGLDLIILSGPEGLNEAARVNVDLVLSAITGIAGLYPTFQCLAHCQMLALANKEAIVTAGQLMLQEAARYGTKIIPVDSEHNAIFQVFEEPQKSTVEKITLTASGGPFRTLPFEHFGSITPTQALRHPNWSMGSKITIDSATLMNKALELIEAKYLFDMPEQSIDILVHPQSIIHSMVHYQDGSVLAQLGSPDMCTPISYALGWPNRISTDVKRLNLAEMGQLTFEDVDPIRFPSLTIARECLNQPNSACVVFNAANEFAVEAFLKNKIGFLDIFRLVRQSLEKHHAYQIHTIEEIMALHRHILKELS